MKLASLEGGRDGRLFVVSEDLGWRLSASEIAPTMRAAMADWARCEPLLRDVAAFLNKGAQRYHRFEPAACVSPLPGPAAQGPSQSQGVLEAADGRTEIRRAAAVIVGDVRQAASRAEAAAAVRLVVLQAVNGAGVAESPVAVTLDSLGEAWRDGRLVGAPGLRLNGEVVSDAPLVLDFASAIVQAAAAGPLAAGTRVSLAEDRPVRLPAAPHGAVVRLELRDSLCRSAFGPVELRLNTLVATALEVA